MAAGIIGAAFGRIVGALIADAVMPPIGLLAGNIAFGNLFVNLSGAPLASLEQARGAGIRAVAKPPGGFFIRMCRPMPAPEGYPQARWSIPWKSRGRRLPPPAETAAFKGLRPGARGAGAMREKEAPREREMTDMRPRRGRWKDQFLSMPAPNAGAGAIRPETQTGRAAVAVVTGLSRRGGRRWAIKGEGAFCSHQPRGWMSSAGMAAPLFLRGRAAR